MKTLFFIGEMPRTFLPPGLEVTGCFPGTIWGDPEDFA